MVVDKFHSNMSYIPSVIAIEHNEDSKAPHRVLIGQEAIKAAERNNNTIPPQNFIAGAKRLIGARYIILVSLVYLTLLQVF